ncbi:hypothetical protein AMAG_17230 [Allomyces macrogynus ATCC 38327]|uniref:Uncharacterized protein n=1 Tax=Allomyces macrogynus (strain ATCC 38327) TaxID=578462 RepID=A0A0L0TEI7_ALLM3|nr:hypothetical protein AMAG_17230 [Allomyces macrogynus ATCC 38327]|eukprot:KNE73076.1 hypothetical protein AMAG_17230 [Allomyces macrogynus ATCC 38327]
MGVHDLSQPRTRDAAERAVRAVQASAGTAVPVLLVGTKCDLVPGFLSQQQIAHQQVQAAARQHPARRTGGAVPTLSVDPAGDGRPHVLAMSMDAPPPPEAFAPFFNQVIATRWPSVGTGSSAYGYDQQHALMSPTMGAAAVLPRSPVLGPPPVTAAAPMGLGLGLGLGLVPAPGPRTASRGPSDASGARISGGSKSIGPEPLPVLAAPPVVPLGGALGMQRAVNSSSTARASAADGDAWRQ